MSTGGQWSFDSSYADCCERESCWIICFLSKQTQHKPGLFFETTCAVGRTHVESCKRGNLSWGYSGHFITDKYQDHDVGQDLNSAFAPSPWFRRKEGLEWLDSICPLRLIKCSFDQLNNIKVWHKLELWIFTVRRPKQAKAKQYFLIKKWFIFVQAVIKLSWVQQDDCLV